jgi:KipI family sensor histidine kinase inhibitor
VTAVRIREAGDAGLLLELEPVVDPAVNARAIGIANALRRLALAGVRDIVPTYRSVAVHFDPWTTDPARLRQALVHAVADEHSTHEGRLIEVPVSYGGVDGPDLDEVATWSGLSPDEVIDRHCEVDYRVFMCGFMPGFAYLGSVNQAIAAPRRARPRVKVPAGSVGIAGRQTGVYPYESPGGWQLIGRTSVCMFDPERSTPALCAPGDRVRFTRDRGAGDINRPLVAAPARLRRDARPTGHLTAPLAEHLTVVRPGLLTTIQDGGRWGHQAAGVPVAGVLDMTEARRANALVGNDGNAAVLEVTLFGPELRFETDVTFAVCGADLGATLDARPQSLNAVVRGRAGAVLGFGQRRNGGRAYVAFGGGIDVPVVLGSRSTHARSAMGGLDGRPLRAGDHLALGTTRAAAPADEDAQSPSVALQTGGQPVSLRVLPGPQRDWFDDAAFEVMEQSTFTVHPQSDRMGLRLSSATPIPRRSPDEMISDATFAGALQVPASGEPILLLADRPTTGGYPQIAVVISADLGLAGQLMPGDRVRFETCSMQTARAALRVDRQKYSSDGPESQA